MSWDFLLRKGLILLILLAASFALLSCGLKGGSPNQGICSGTQLAAGSLSGSGGSSAQGVVSSFDQGNGTYCININSISYSGSCTNAMIVMAQSGGNFYAAGSITIFSGTQNFSYSGSAPTIVYFHCQSDQSAPLGMRASATLTPI